MNRNDNNKDSIIKGVGTILLGLVILALIYNVFFTPQMSYGMLSYGGGGNMHGGMDMGGMYGQTGMGTGFGLGLGSLLAGILIILIKLLSILLVVGLVIGIWIVVKDYLFAGGDPLAALTQSLAKPRMNCPKCRSTVDTKWDYCPDCGQPLTKEIKPTTDGANQGQ